MFWEYRGSRAVRDGRRKLVAERGGTWELYDLQKDRTEMNDLVAQHPDVAQRMIGQYDAWAERVGARTTEAAQQMLINQQDRYLYEGEKATDNK